MVLDIDTITRTVSSILQEQGQALELVGVASTEGGSGRVELMITVAGCHREPCRLLVNVTRTDQVTFEHELRSKLADVLANHHDR